MSKYTAEQVRACILAYKNGDLNYCRSGIVDLLTEYAATLDAEGDGGAVGEVQRDVCPITKRPFFMSIEHPSLGIVDTYGGPFDSYTIPEPDEDGCFRSERYDHDAGEWIEGGNPEPLMLVHDDEYNDLYDRANNPHPARSGVVRDEEMNRCERLLTACTCHADFKDRDMLDPQCRACDLGVEVIDTLRSMRAALAHPTRDAERLKEIVRRAEKITGSRCVRFEVRFDPLSGQGLNLIDYIDAAIQGERHER